MIIPFALATCCVHTHTYTYMAFVCLLCGYGGRRSLSISDGLTILQRRRRRRTHPCLCALSPLRSVSQSHRAKYDARRHRSGTANIPHWAGRPEPGGPCGQKNADQGPRGPVGAHTGEHVQELGERARVAVEPRQRFDRGPVRRARALRAGGEPAGQEDTLVDPEPSQPASHVGERVQSPDRHSRRRCETSQYR